MNRVQWLRERVIASGWIGKRAEGKIFPKSGAANHAANVFIALPRRHKISTVYRLTAPVPPHVFVLPPLQRKDSAKRPHKRVSTAWVSLFSLVATVFAAIGILQIMISTMHLSAYGQSGLHPSIAAHKPGSGPALEDAVENEYQHALTREHIAAADTNIVTNTANGAALPKGLLDDVEVSAPAPEKRGDSRQVRIFNGTRSTIDKVIVQVEILNKAGHLLRTENITADSLSPLGVRVLELGNVLPDAQVHCYIQEIRSKSLRTSLRAL
ncbi:hypothetical protein SAMN05444008_102149 [Cnuella takakiae]|uniref:Uncharacterized protein n=1 Tax=Cnuella takakiae TaxID=1302690 RepID=A0A1M4V614_9BACT|nr:hypothetical protein [Cnuella takakiae]OLY92695.1 hypothetical protein BUE76_12965 [Cnuella takakiae]SHE64426.1 hypothetical protein SAMN05444008_102149 [Cnuella takakiae]